MNNSQNAVCFSLFCTETKLRARSIFALSFRFSCRNNVGRLRKTNQLIAFATLISLLSKFNLVPVSLVLQIKKKLRIFVDPITQAERFAFSSHNCPLHLKSDNCFLSNHSSPFHASYDSHSQRATVCTQSARPGFFRCHSSRHGCLRGPLFSERSSDLSPTVAVILRRPSCKEKQACKKAIKSLFHGFLFKDCVEFFIIAKNNLLCTPVHPKSDIITFKLQEENYFLQSSVITKCKVRLLCYFKRSHD